MNDLDRRLRATLRSLDPEPTTAGAASTAEGARSRRAWPAVAAAALLATTVVGGVAVVRTTSPAPAADPYSGPAVPVVPVPEEPVDPAAWTGQPCGGGRPYAASTAAIDADAVGEPSADAVVQQYERGLLQERLSGEYRRAVTQVVTKQVERSPSDVRVRYFDPDGRWVADVSALRVRNGTWVQVGSGSCAG